MVPGTFIHLNWSLVPPDFKEGCISSWQLLKNIESPSKAFILTMKTVYLTIAIFEIMDLLKKMYIWAVSIFSLKNRICSLLQVFFKVEKLGWELLWNPPFNICLSHKTMIEKNKVISLMNIHCWWRGLHGECMPNGKMYSSLVRHSMLNISLVKWLQ